jgi:hypothetical protein
MNVVDIFQCGEIGEKFRSNAGANGTLGFPIKQPSGRSPRSQESRQHGSRDRGARDNGR